MHKFYLLPVLLFVCINLKGQVYDGPESCEKDYTDGGVFVSNANAGNIVKLMPGGNLVSFASGFTSGPHGLELIGDTLYACDGANIVLVNRSTGAFINTVNLGASFLNGITHVGKNLFITDFSAKRIYRLNTANNTFNVFASTLTKTPNGIIYDYLNNRLVYCCWGSSAPVYEISLSDSTINLLATTATANCDGIAMNCQGEFFIASWSPNAIKKYDPTFSSSTTLSLSGIGSPADIYFDLVDDTLYIPNSGNNTVTETDQPSCFNSVECYCGIIDNTQIYPNPLSDHLIIENNGGFELFKMIDARGRVVFSSELANSINSFSLENISPGIYFVHLLSGKHVRTIKVCKEK
ncbi:MAG TPA: T9SS type A sorting domain-containing protein [Flavobacteriales bacterium]|nr:T9SS type A sorting domain-containing protein [Flavobacteriales bacterium]